MQTIRTFLAFGLIALAVVTMLRIMMNLKFSDLLTHAGVGSVASSRVPLLTATLVIALIYLERIVAAASNCAAGPCALPGLTPAELAALQGGAAFYLIDKSRISGGAAPLLSNLLNALTPGK